MPGSALGSAPCSEGVPPVSRSGAPPAAGSPASALSGDRRPRRARGRHATPSAHSLTRVLAQQGNIANDSQARFYESWSRRGNELNEWKQRGRGWRSGEGSETLSVLCSGGRASVVRCRCPGRSAVLSAGCRGSRGGRGLQTRCEALSEAPRQPGRLGSPCLRCSSQLADLGSGGEGKEGRSPPPPHTHTSSSQPEFRDGATPGCWGGVEVGTVQSCPGPDPAATSEGWLPAWPGERDAAASPADHAEDLPPPEASTGLVSSVDGWGGGADVAGDADNVRLAFAAPGLAPRLPADFSAPQRCARGSLLCGPRPRSRGSP